MLFKARNLSKDHLKSLIPVAFRQTTLKTLNDAMKLFSQTDVTTLLRKHNIKRSDDLHKDKKILEREVWREDDVAVLVVVNFFLFFPVCFFFRSYLPLLCFALLPRPAGAEERGLCHLER